MPKTPVCKGCGAEGHYKIRCLVTAKKPISSSGRPEDPKALELGGIKKGIKRGKKKSSKALLKKNLEVLVKEFVKRRDNYTCQRCNEVVSGANCHASHVIPVSRSGYLQFEPLNMKVLCYHDHINWWHKHPIEAGKWFTDTFPERWEYLRELHIKRLKPMNEQQLKDKVQYYKDLL